MDANDSKFPSSNTDRINWQINEFCAGHRVGRTLVYEEIKRGELRIIKVGKRTLIPDSEAKAWQARKLERSNTKVIA